MSDPVRCEVCHKKGPRRLFKSCPEGWFYGEVMDDDDPHPDNILIVTVCSVECCAKFWCNGPVSLRTSPDYIKVNNG